MPSLNELINCLEQTFHLDHWEDDAKLYAYQLVGALEAQDWEKLAYVWNSHDHGWQAKLAQSLQYGRREKSIPILRGLLLSSNTDVSMASADSLRSIEEDGEETHLSDNHVLKLEELAKLSRLNKLTLENLIRKYKVSPA